MMNVKEDITVFLGFEDTAAVQASADDFERLNQRVFDTVKFKLAELFNIFGKEKGISLSYNSAIINCCAVVAGVQRHQACGCH